MDLSIVSTLYRSEPYIDAFVRRCMQAAARITYDFEIVLVDDGSPDGVLSKGLALQQQHKQIRIVELSTNFGHHRALMTGLCFARGRRVFLIDSDLEEDPAWLIDFWQSMDNSGADVVFGVQGKRKGGLVERFFGAAFYWLIDKLSHNSIQANSVTARLMTEQYVAGLTQFQEREFAIGDLYVRAGFRQISLQVDKAYRGDSSYSFRKRAGNALRAIVSTSTVPLSLIFGFGLIVCLLSGIYITVLLLRFIFVSVQVEGWTSLILSVWFFGGLSLMAMGTIGLYIAEIFRETKRRPYVVIRAVHDPGGDVLPTYPLDAAGIIPLMAENKLTPLQAVEAQKISK
jgi:putative glycosyltransferase